MNKILIVGRYTFVEIVKSRVMTNTLFLGIAVAFVAYLSAGVTYGVPEKTSLDIGLGLLSLSLNGIAIFMGVSIVAKEVEQRTIYMVLARPVSRDAYLIGRLLGMTLILFVDVLILGSIITAIIYLLGGAFSSFYGWVLFFILIEAVTLLFVVVLFSLVTNITMSVIYTLSVYMVGHGLVEALEYAKNVGENQFIPIIKLTMFIFPNFSKLNIKDFLLYQKELGLDYIFKTTIYFVVYLGGLFVLANALLRKKDLD